MKKGLLTKRMGNISINFFLPNPFGNWGSKGVIYFSLVKLLIESKNSAGGAHEMPSNVFVMKKPGLPRPHNYALVTILFYSKQRRG